MRILVVEDEIDMNRTLVRKLEAEHYNVDSCFDGKAALEYMELATYDGVILDIMLPEIDGFEVLRQAREKEIATPIMLLSARDNTLDIVKGLDQGADDYLVKPFSFAELMARLRVMLRKPAVQANYDNMYRCGSLILDLNSQSVIKNGQRVDLSHKEFAVLLFLVRNQNHVVSREQIESNIWNIRNETSSNVVDVYIRYLRKKLDERFNERMILTVRGVGYKLVCAETQEKQLEQMENLKKEK